MLNLLKKLRLKKDGSLFVVLTAIVLVTGALIMHKDVTAKEGFALMTGALTLFVTTKDDDKEKTDDP